MGDLMTKIVQCVYSPFQAKPYTFMTDLDLQPRDLVIAESGGNNNPFGFAIVQVWRTENIPPTDVAKATKWIIQKITPRQ
jgi:hypothetical protein